jgi:hypothetical protein
MVVWKEGVLSEHVRSKKMQQKDHDFYLICEHTLQ